MDLAYLLAMYRFNTWANENLRSGIATGDDETLRRPLDIWFGSAFNILAHLCAGEVIWLARLRDGQSPAGLLTAADFTSLSSLLETWRNADSAWEAYVSTLTDEMLATTVTWQRQEGDTFTNQLWQLVIHVAFHSSEHRGQASVALTQLGVSHGPQDFFYQFLPPPRAPRSMSAPV